MMMSHTTTIPHTWDTCRHLAKIVPRQSNQGSGSLIITPNVFGVFVIVGPCTGKNVGQANKSRLAEQSDRAKTLTLLRIALSVN